MRTLTIADPALIGAKGVAAPPAISWHAAFWADDPDWSDPGDGIAVSSWRDLSGNGRTLSQGTGSNQPLYRASVVGLNGRSGVEFDGSNDRMVTAAWSSLSQPFSYVLIATWSSLGSGQRGAMDGPSGSPAALFTDATAGRINLYSGGGGYWQGPTISTGKHAVRAKFQSSSSAINVDGSGPGSNVPAGPGTTGNTGLTLGSLRDGSGASAMTAAFAGVYAGDVTAAGNWEAFCAWVSTIYGSTLG